MQVRTAKPPLCHALPCRAALLRSCAKPVQMATPSPSRRVCRKLPKRRPLALRETRVSLSDSIRGWPGPARRRRHGGGTAMVGGVSVCGRGGGGGVKGCTSRRRTPAWRRRSRCFQSDNQYLGMSLATNYLEGHGAASGGGGAAEKGHAKPCLTASVSRESFRHAAGARGAPDPRVTAQEPGRALHKTFR